MLDCVQVYRLLDWVKYAKSLIKNRTFGVDQSQADGDASIIKFQRFDHKNDLILYKDPA